jgi:hypothetical protein
MIRREASGKANRKAAFFNKITRPRKIRFVSVVVSVLFFEGANGAIGAKGGMHDP